MQPPSSLTKQTSRVGAEVEEEALEVEVGEGVAEEVDLMITYTSGHRSRAMQML